MLLSVTEGSQENAVSHAYIREARTQPKASFLPQILKLAHRSQNMHAKKYLIPKATDTFRKKLQDTKQDANSKICCIQDSYFNLGFTIKF